MKPPDPFVSRSAAPDDASDASGWWLRRDLVRDTLVVADADGSLAAHAVLRDEGGETLDLDAFVHPDRLGHGLGSFLIDWAEEEARSRARSVVRTSALAADPARGRWSRAAVTPSSATFTEC